MKLNDFITYSKLVFEDTHDPMYFSSSKQLDALMKYLIDVSSGISTGKLNIINAETGCGKTMLMKGFCRDLVSHGKTCIFQTSQQFVTDLILAISRGGISPTLHKNCDVYIVDDCFSLFPETLKVLDEIHRASPSTTMILLFDGCIPLEKYVLPRLQVDNVFEISAPCEAARQAFTKDYLSSEAGRSLNISVERALLLASEHKHIAPLRAAIQRESIERGYQRGTD